tara:strand:+ start:742 stop:1251 length:510 start_codon:yes stop_codon:yes gene_type:complete
MSEFISARLALPLLQAGQSQKEMSHNEALTRIDIACQAAVEAVQSDTPPPDPLPGQCWIVGTDPSDAWSGHAGALACWTAGGWRFVEPQEGMSAWDRGAQVPALFRDGSWRIGEVHGRLIVDGQQLVGPRLAAIGNPEGGTQVDAEAREVIAQVLAAMREHGLIAADEM